MFRGIVGLVDGDPDGEIGRHRGRTNIEGERIQDLDGSSLVTGTASGTITTERDVPVVGDDFITTDRETVGREVYTEFLADLGGGWVTIDSSNGEFLWDFLAAKHRITIERAEIDLNALVETIRRWESVDVWQSQTDWGDPGEETAAGGVTIAYHGDAEWPRGDRAGQLGFEGLWNGGHVRGTVAASGYVALFDATGEIAGRFVSEVLLPHCSIPDDEDDDQTTLGGSSS